MTLWWLALLPGLLSQEPAFAQGPCFFSMDFNALWLAGADPLEGRAMRRALHCE